MINKTHVLKLITLTFLLLGTSLAQSAAPRDRLLSPPSVADRDRVSALDPARRAIIENLTPKWLPNLAEVDPIQELHILRQARFSAGSDRAARG